MALRSRWLNVFVLCILKVQREKAYGVVRGQLLNNLSVAKVESPIDFHAFFQIHNIEDEVVWEHAKSGVFSVKSAYSFQLFRGHAYVFDEGQARFELWGLDLPPKFQLFIWKVLHRIIVVKDVLLRRNIQIRGMEWRLGCRSVRMGKKWHIRGLFALCSAASASMVEIREGISALQWAVGQGFFTDCAVFVQGLRNQRKLILVCRQPC
ncbi:hypothetical protein RHMOL_Rhmol09G0267000 [Rhododendron molle]|uniref:Uncharacterized protein n=1 Tax=Rhododendron molle TaxID=49168 RepID=A0ACC0MJ16_RHOML|nr:hypothetical protein RHMOL_Rhmol09G0267000 [Rhododendron molle]